MDYRALAVELIDIMQSLHKARPHKHISEALSGEAFVLHCVAHHGGVMLPGEISAEMEVSSARVAAALNSLEKKGLITRRIDPNDRRRILVELTPEGGKAAADQLQMAVETAAAMLAHLGERDAREYVRITGKLAEMPPK